MLKTFVLISFVKSDVRKTSKKYRIVVKFSFYMSNNLEFWLNFVFFAPCQIYMYVPTTLCTNKKLKNYECNFKKTLTPKWFTNKIITKFKDRNFNSTIFKIGFLIEF